MELEKLKSKWQIHSSQRGDQLYVSESSLEKLLEDKSKSIKRKVLRRMSYDALFMILVISASISVLYYLNLQSRNLATIIILSTGFILFIHYHITTLLLNRNFKNRSVKHQINYTLVTLRRYLFLYQWITPLVFGGITFLAWRYKVFFVLGFSEENPSLIFQISSSILLAIITWLLLRLIIRWSFRKEISNLKNITNELEQQL